MCVSLQVCVCLVVCVCVPRCVSLQVCVSGCVCVSPGVRLCRCVRIFPRLHLTVEDGDIPVLVVLRQSDGGSRDGGYDPDRAAAVRALQMGRVALLHPPKASAAPMTPGGPVGVWVSEGLARAVTAVGLVPPLDHGGLGGDTGVLARQNHRLEQQSILPVLSYRHLDSPTGWDGWRRRGVGGRRGGGARKGGRGERVEV